MKNYQFKMLVTAPVIMLAVIFSAFRLLPEGASVKGKINPADAAVRAWAISSTDTLKADITNGMFEITGVKPGNYIVVIEANKPYKNAQKNDVKVVDEQPVDLGEIPVKKD